jgi:hypothetical protein
MTAIYTFDIFSSLDGFGSYDGGDWGGYWGKQGPEFLDRRLALYSEEQRMVFGANTYRQCVEVLGPSTEQSMVVDPVNTRLRNLPATVVSTTLEGPLDYLRAPASVSRISSAATSRSLRLVWRLKRTRVLNARSEVIV